MSQGCGIKTKPFLWTFSSVNLWILIGFLKFLKGICLCFWIFLEDTPISESYPQKLFTLHCSGNGGGGLEAYFLGKSLFYRVLPINYTEPSSGSNGVFLGEYQVKTWCFIGIEHERAKNFGRAYLNVRNLLRNSFVLLNLLNFINKIWFFAKIIVNYWFSLGFYQPKAVQEL